jgi:hypothetical protein
MHPFENVQGKAGFSARKSGVCAARLPMQSLSVCAPIEHTVSELMNAPRFETRALEGLLCTQ